MTGAWITTLSGVTYWDDMVRRTYVEPDPYCRGTGGVVECVLGLARPPGSGALRGPRNVLLRRADGTLVVRPFRGLRRV